MKEKHEQVASWLAKVDSDMKIAKREMQAPDAASDAVCFHFQQASEKLLKAWLNWRDLKHPLTHNLEVLLDVCEETDQSFSTLRGIEVLTPYAVAVRYADDAYFPTVGDMTEAARLADETQQFVMSKLIESGWKMREATQS